MSYGSGEKAQGLRTLAAPPEVPSSRIQSPAPHGSSHLSVTTVLEVTTPSLDIHAGKIPINAHKIKIINQEKKISCIKHLHLPRQVSKVCLPDILASHLKIHIKRHFHLKALLISS